MPIILDSDLQKLKEEAANKSQSERSFRTRSASVEDETATQEQPAEEQPATVDPTSNNKPANVAQQDTKTATKSAAGSSSVNKFRERQKKLKGSR
jgi:hypothetical protein